MSVKVAPYNAKSGMPNQYIVGTDETTSKKYLVNRKNVKKFAEEFNSIDITKTAQNSLAAGIVGTLTVIGAAKFAKKIPLIAKIPLAFFAFCGISILTCLPNNLIANKKVEETAKKYDAKEVKIKNLDKNA